MENKIVHTSPTPVECMFSHDGQVKTNLYYTKRLKGLSVITPG